jgi:hypothetical protein
MSALNDLALVLVNIKAERVMVTRVDFASEAFFCDPAAAVATLRAAGLAAETRFRLVGKVWARDSNSVPHYSAGRGPVT